MIALGVGMELRPHRDVGIRLACETPLTDTTDLFNYRWTFSLVWSF